MYFEYLATFAKLWFFLGCLSMPCIMLNYTGTGLEGLQAPGIQAKLGKTTFGNLYPPPRNVTYRVRDCEEFENSKCCTDEVTGAMIGMEDDVTGCAANMQEMLYGLYCNATFWDTTFNICDDLCTRVYDACGGVDVMVPDSGALRRRNQVGALSAEEEAAILERRRVLGMPAHQQFCVKSFFGDARNPDRLSTNVWVKNATDACVDPSDTDACLGDGEICYGATHQQMGTDPNFKAGISKLRLHLTAFMDFCVSITLILFYFWFGKETQADIQDQDDDMTTMGDYTIQIEPDSIPVDTTKEELKTWVEGRFGEGCVAQDQIVDGQPWSAITMLYDNDEEIVLQQKKGKLQDLYDKHEGRFNYFTAMSKVEPKFAKAAAKEKKKMEATQTKLDKQLKKIDEELEKAKKDPKDGGKASVSAFVVFENDETYEDALMWQTVSKFQEPGGAIIAEDGEERKVGGTREIRAEEEDEKGKPIKFPKVHIKAAEEPDTIIHANIEYGTGERKCRRRLVNFLLLIILLGSFLGIIIISGYKTDEKYLIACGGRNIPGTVLYHDKYYPEMDLCPADFNALTNAQRDSDWVRPGDVVSRAESDDEANIFNNTFKAYQICAKYDLNDGAPEQPDQTCTHPPFLNEVHMERQNPYFENTFSMCFQCMCSSQEDEVKSWISDYEDTTGESQYCWTYQKFKGTNSMWKLIATAIIVAINQVLKQILVRIVAFEKPHSLGEKMSSTALKVFIAQTFNTGALILIMNADLTSPNLGIVGEMLGKLMPAKKGATYADFDQGWFANVGAAMCMTMLIQNCTPPSIQCVKSRLGRKKQDKVLKATEMMKEIDRVDDQTGKPWTGRCGCPCCCIYRPKWWVRKCFGNKAAYHQEALDESVESPDFNMAASYGESYLLLFITCLYATGMPILTWFAFFGFT